MLEDLELLHPLLLAPSQLNCPAPRGGGGGGLSLFSRLHFYIRQSQGFRW